ncbi:MAG: pyridoxamine 5'-phosphate oxidase family protein [Clostridia bacterium]|nr:pyridoxamine 5'-phosphate oxidase family protein [Clostridia bacterium]
MEKVSAFLDEAQVYYLATVEGDQPRVRPFGTALVHNGRLYIQTGKVKPVSKQLAVNPKAEICAFSGGKWLRVAGELVNDDDRAVKVVMLEKMPSLKSMYDPDDGNMQMLYFKNAVATFSSFTAAPETINL